MELEEIKKQLDENTKKIVNNMNQIHQNSGALEILKDFKGDNRRMFIILLIVLFMWFFTIGYLVYILNDTGTIEEDSDTIDIQDVEVIDNTHIKIGDDVWEVSN